MQVVRAVTSRARRLLSSGKTHWLSPRQRISWENDRKLMDVTLILFSSWLVRVFYSLQKVKVKVKQRGPVQKATDSASALALFILRAHHPVSCSFRPTSWAPLDDDTAGSTSSPRASSPCICCVVRIVEPATSPASETANGVQLVKKVNVEQFSCTTLRSCQIWARACEGWPGGVKLQD